MSYKYVLNVCDVGFTDGLYFTLNIHTVYFNMFNTHLYMCEMKLHNISLIDIISDTMNVSLRKSQIIQNLKKRKNSSLTDVIVPTEENRNKKVKMLRSERNKLHLGKTCIG